MIRWEPTGSKQALARKTRLLAAPREETRPQILRLETRGEITALICTDQNSCSLPFATVENGMLKIKSKHHSSQCENGLTLAHVMMLAVEMRRQLQKPELW